MTTASFGSPALVHPLGSSHLVPRPGEEWTDAEWAAFVALERYRTDDPRWLGPMGTQLSLLEETR